jgi:hypothetical protein
VVFSAVVLLWRCVVWWFLFCCVFYDVVSCGGVFCGVVFCRGVYCGVV